MLNRILFFTLLNFVCPQSLGQRAPWHTIITWLGGRHSLISEVEETKMLEPDMLLQKLKEQLVNSFHPEIQYPNIVWDPTATPGMELGSPCSSLWNDYWETRFEVVEENIKAKSTSSWLHFKTQDSEYTICCMLIFNEFLYSSVLIPLWRSILYQVE